MCARRKRGLMPEEEQLWRLVTESIVPRQPPRATCTASRPRDPVSDGSVETAKSNFIRDFQIRGTASAGLVRVDLAPTPAEQLAAAPLRMDRKAFMRMNRGKLAPDARIDLHGLTLAAAHPALTGFVMQSHCMGRRLILVITGKGRPGLDDGPIPQRSGVLKHQVPQWLSSPPLSSVVLQVTEAHRRHGGSGAYYVYLRRAA